MTKLKSIYEAKGKAKEYAELAVNLFDTCCHNCIYCYVPHVMHKDPANFFGDTRARKNIIPKLIDNARQLKMMKEKREILLCFTCDPYQSNSEICKETTRTALSVLFNSDLNVTVLTKGGSRSLRDIDLFEAHKDQFRYGVTLVFAKDLNSLFYEPYATPTSERIETLKIIHDKGIRTWVSIEPAWSIEDTINIIKYTHEFVDIYKIGKLNYHPHADDVDWARYTKEVIAKLRELNKAFYLKEDLRPYQGDD